MDRGAATRATALTVGVVVLLLLVQTAVGTALVRGTQPMAVRDQVASQPTAATWEDVPSRSLELSGQQMARPYGGGSVTEMEVQAMTNDTHVAFRLSWTDSTQDGNISAPTAYSDAVALMLHGGEQPPITMGAMGTPVNIWYWRASWQFGDHADTGDWTGDMYAYPHPNETTKPGLAAGNPLSKAEYSRYGQNYYAKGYGSLSHAPAQNVEAYGTRTADGWQVTFVRERTTNGTYDAALNESQQLYITVAVWNGSADEVNGQKSLSYRYLTLDTKTGALTAPESSGSDSGSGSGEGGAAGGSGAASGGSGGGSGGAGGLPSVFWDSLGTVVAVIVVTWIVAYRSLRGDGR